MLYYLFWLPCNACYLVKIYIYIYTIYKSWSPACQSKLNLLNSEFIGIYIRKWLWNIKKNLNSIVIIEDNCDKLQFFNKISKKKLVHNSLFYLAITVSSHAMHVGDCLYIYISICIYVYIDICDPSHSEKCDV